jgi:DNA-binding response OmpR family regulator
MSGEKILLVDNDEERRKYVSRLLQRAGYCVAEASGGETAILSVKASPPHLIITKLFMTQDQAVPLIQQLRANAGVPILAYTPITDRSRLEALEAGVNDFLTRPFHATELLARTRSLLVTGQVIRENAELKLTLDAEQRGRAQSLQRAHIMQSESRAEAERARRELDATINALTDGVVLTDVHGRITRANSEAGMLFNRPVHALISEFCSELFVAGTACPHHLLSEEHPSAAGERSSRHADIRLTIRTHRVTDARGSLIGFTHVLRELAGEQRSEPPVIARPAYAAAGRIAD